MRPGRGRDVDVLGGLGPGDLGRVRPEEAGHDVRVPLWPAPAAVAATVEVSVVRGENYQPALLAEGVAGLDRTDHAGQPLVLATDGRFILGADAVVVRGLVVSPQVDEAEVVVLGAQAPFASSATKLVGIGEALRERASIEPGQRPHPGTEEGSRAIFAAEDQG